MKSLATLIGASILCFALSNCGGGDSDGSETTVRPKSMDGLILSLDTNAAQFEFVRNSGTSAALNSGDVETGAFFYTSFLGGVNWRNYENLRGDRSNFLYPQSVSAASYSYKAINASSGVLTLTGTGSLGAFSFFDFFGLASIIDNDSLMRPFVASSPSGTTVSPLGFLIDDAVETNVVQIDLTFAANGSFVTVDSITVSQPESPVASTFDTIRMPARIMLAAGGGVPENYNPEIDPLRPSRIAPNTLSQRLLRAKNSARRDAATVPPDPFYGAAGTEADDEFLDFTIGFVADASQSGDSGNGDEVEVGQAIFSVFEITSQITDPLDPTADPIVNGKFTPVSIAADYTWRRIPGTDTGELVLSNIPTSDPSVNFVTGADIDGDPSTDDMLPRFGSPPNGTYILKFLGPDSGTYEPADGGLTPAEDFTGGFNFLDN